MRILITMMGLSIWGTFNSVWAIIRRHDYVPDIVYMLTTEADRTRSETAGKMLAVLLEEYSSRADIRFVIIKGDDVKEVVEKVREIALRHKGKGDVVALDVTPGRKAVVLGSVFAGWGRDLLDRIFYLYMESLFNANRPHILIPMAIQHPHEIIREAK
ncbi:MAG: hypothetical protein FJ151_00390 [Euryarchaeota archaeon]|nr:hypothetical protein [Euryarchaeota archaeon]